MTELGVSLLSSDFADLGGALKKYGQIADFIHMDVMDGNFVANLTFGPPVIDDLRKHSKMFFEAHLMVANPRKQWRWYERSCERIIFHIETDPHPLSLLKKIDTAEKGISLNPETPFSRVEKLLPYADVLLVMAVHPGFAAQKFNDKVLKKIERLRKFIDSNGLGCRISVDGGINASTARQCVAAGADIIITSSWLSSGRSARKAEFIRKL